MKDLIALRLIREMLKDYFSLRKRFRAISGSPTPHEQEAIKRFDDIIQELTEYAELFAKH